MIVDKSSSAGGNFAPRSHLKCVKMFLFVTTRVSWGGGGVLLNTPQCTGQQCIGQSHDKELSSSNVNSAEVKTPWGEAKIS